MRKRWTRVWLILAFFNLAQCRKVFNPPAIQASNHFVVVDGVINTGPDAVSKFKVSRSLNLQDTVADRPELNAQVMIRSANGDLYPLFDVNANGVYVSDALNLNPALQYQLSVKTQDQSEYLSDLVTPLVSPPIDSISWQRVFDPVAGTDVVNVYANTHDPANKTHYYRWQYEEVWQHQAYFQTFWVIENGYIHGDADSKNFNCWSTDTSHSILLGTSIALSSDVISQALLARFIKDDPKMDIGYSMLVSQLPMDLDAYKYWITVQKNSQSLGGLFDLQPSQIRGNIHGVTNPNDPVLGYVSASSVQQQRLFIPHTRLPDWQSNGINGNCKLKSIASVDSNELVWNYPDTSYGLYSFTGSFHPTLNITTKNCLDCRYSGGTNIKPSFWP